MDDIRNELQHYACKKSTYVVSTRSFYQARKSMSPFSSRQISLPTPIHHDCIKLINKKAPNKILNVLRSKGLTKNYRSLSVECAQMLSPKKQSRFLQKVFQSQYCRQRFRFSQLQRKQHTSRQELKTKLGLFKTPREEFSNIDKANITYFEKRFPESEKTLGRYKEPMHPLCKLYQRQSDRFLSYRLKLAKSSEEL